MLVLAFRVRVLKKINSIIRLFTYFVFASMCTGCLTLHSISDGTPIQPSQGLLAMEVTSPSSAILNYVQYNATTSFGTRLAEDFSGPVGKMKIEPGTTYWVIPIDAGDYMWSRVQIENKFSNIQSTNKFSIQANTITYIGHINLSMTGFRLEMTAHDHEDDVRRYLEQTYPAYASKMSFVKNMMQFNTMTFEQAQPR